MCALLISFFSAVVSPEISQDHEEISVLQREQPS